jgi:hypothetical protein
LSYHVICFWFGVVAKTLLLSRTGMCPKVGRSGKKNIIFKVRRRRTRTE